MISLISAFLKVTYAAAISACENRIAWEAALVLLDDAKRDLTSLILETIEMLRMEVVGGHFRCYFCLPNSISSLLEANVETT